MNAPIDEKLFEELIEGEKRLGPEEPITRDSQTTDVGYGFSITVGMNAGGRRKGFEILRDIITRHRRNWASEYFNSYLRARWEFEIKEAAKSFNMQPMARAGRPLVPQHSSSTCRALRADHQWILGELSVWRRVGAGGIRRYVKPPAPIAGRPTMRASTRVEGRAPRRTGRVDRRVGTAARDPQHRRPDSARRQRGRTGRGRRTRHGGRRRANACASIGSVAATSIFPGRTASAPRSARRRGRRRRSTRLVAGATRVDRRLRSSLDDPRRAGGRRPLQPDRGDLARPVRPGLGNARDGSARPARRHTDRAPRRAVRPWRAGSRELGRGGRRPARDLRRRDRYRHG